jgi:hypothetical protein
MKWVDVRIHAEDYAAAQRAVLDAFAPVDLRIDFNPPAVVPEIEMSISGHSEAEVLAVLRSGTIDVLAARTRLDVSTGE